MQGAGRCGFSSIGRRTGFNHALVQQAESAGFEAIVLTVDAPVQGVRDAERQAGFAPPAGIHAVPCSGAPRAHGRRHLLRRPAAHAPWDDVAWLQAHAPAGVAQGRAAPAGCAPGAGRAWPA
jgi:isopentenyl diphosphate isomerase/L-lactate dehydrogenase-like FMN-dependent dehydrogenase